MVLALLIKREVPTAEVFEAGDGNEALKFFNELGADLLITDYQMPGLNGADLIRTVRILDPRVAVIMISGAPAAKQIAYAAGADWFLHKDNAASQLPAILLSRFPRIRSNRPAA